MFRLRNPCKNRNGQLVQQFELKLCRYREVISLPFPPMAIASLRVVCQRCCTRLLAWTPIEVLHLFRCSTHTHTPRRTGLFSEESARQSKKSETDAARRVLQDQEVELSSRSRIARVSKSIRCHAVCRRSQVSEVRKIGRRSCPRGSQLVSHLRAEAEGRKVLGSGRDSCWRRCR